MKIKVRELWRALIACDDYPVDYVYEELLNALDRFYKSGGTYP